MFSGTGVSSFRLVSHSEIMSYLYKVLCASKSETLEKLSLLSVFKFQLQYDNNTLENSELTWGPGFGWTSELRNNNRLNSQ